MEIVILAPRPLELLKHPPDITAYFAVPNNKIDYTRICAYKMALS